MTPSKLRNSFSTGILPYSGPFGCLTGGVSFPPPPMATTLRQGLAHVAAYVLFFPVYAGFLVLLTSEGISMYRGWRNTDGTIVRVYGVYEKQYSSSTATDQLRKDFPGYEPRQGWELLNFYHWESLCSLRAEWSQRAWASDRTRLLSRSSAGVSFIESDLPLIRYQCLPMEMEYPSGMGWGLF